MAALTILSDFCGLLAAYGAESQQAFEAAYHDILESLQYIGPEAILAVFALGIFLIDLVIPVKASRHLAWIAIAGCVIAEHSIDHHAIGDGHSLFAGMIAVDSFSVFFKQLFLLGSIPVVLMSYASFQLDGRRMGEYYGILLCAVLGAMLMAASTHFLMVFMALELLSVSSYVLVGYVRRDRRGAEAALKYVIYGSVAAGIMLFGMSLVYGLTGSADIREIGNVVWETEHARWPAAALSTRAALAALTGLVMVFMGLAYKMSTIPMHFWAPDVYDGAPTPVTAFLSVLSKAAGFALALRFLSFVPVGPDLPEVWAKVPWVEFLVVVAVVTMTLGNLAAIWQTNLKRLLAYSSIAHAGYMLMGVAILQGPGGGALEVSGSQVVSFYLLAYLAMNFGAFAVVLLIENRLGSVSIDAYRGLGKRAPFLAVSMTVFLFSLIGLPPTAGFAGKFQLFKGVVDAARDPSLEALSGWYWFLLIAAGINTAVSAYYYLRIAKEMFLVDTPDRMDEVRTSVLGRIVVAAMVVLTFYFFFGADGILETTSKLALRL